MSRLNQSIQEKPLKPDSDLVMVQVGWLGATGEVYPLKEPPYDKEKGSFTPLYMSIGNWELSDEGTWIIND